MCSIRSSASPRRRADGSPDSLPRPTASASLARAGAWPISSIKSPATCAGHAHARPRLNYALAAGRISKETPYLKRAEYAASRVDAFIASMEELDAAAALFRAQPPMLPEAAEERLKTILRELAGENLA